MSEEILKHLTAVPIFSRLQSHELHKLIEAGESRSYDVDDTIVRQDQQAEAIWLLLSGRIRIDQEYRDGRRKTLAFMTAGNFFGEMGLILHVRHCATATAHEKCEVFRIGKDTFMGVLHSHSELCFSVLQELCKRLRRADDEICNITFRNIPGRIAFKIFELSDQFGVPDKDGTLIMLDINQWDLAEMVGTNRETVSKYISLFKKEGAISTHKRHIVVKDLKKLLAWK